MAIPFFLYRTGNVPSVVSSGPRSMLAFWMGGASSSGTAPRRSVGGLGRSKRYVSLEKPDVWSRTLTPKNLREIRALLKAEHKAADKADQLKQAEAKDALNEAADAAREALETIHQADIAPPPIDRLTKLLEGASRAKQSADVISQARQAVEIANQIVADIEEEEEAIALLLLV